MFGGLRNKIASLFSRGDKIAEEKLKEEPVFEKPAEPTVQAEEPAAKEIVSEIKPAAEKKIEKAAIALEKKKREDAAIVPEKKHHKVVHDEEILSESVVISEELKPVRITKADLARVDLKGEEIREKSFLPKLTLGTKLKQAILRKAVVSEADIESLIWDFNLELLEADVSVSVADKICGMLKSNLVGKEISSRHSIRDLTNEAIRAAVEEIIIEPDFDILDRAKSKKPFVIMFVGPNGHGKSTTIGKLAHYIQKKGLSCVLVAADTFRAAAIEQLETIGNNAGVKVIRQQYGSDPAAVAFDGVKHAEAKGIDVVLIDTAGRSELNTNLMEQIKKLVRVAKPDMKIYIGEALAGNAAVEEAKKFDEFIGIDGVIMTKTDCDVKGGSILSISYETKKPILFIGTGQSLDDLEPFRKKWFMEKIFEE